MLDTARDDLARRRRIPDYAQQFADWNMVASIGAFWFGATQLLFLYSMIQCARGIGPKAPAKPWEGADTLEWTVPSPAPYHTFETPPRIARPRPDVG